MDKNIASLSVPLGQLKEEVLVNTVYIIHCLFIIRHLTEGGVRGARIPQYRTW